MEHTVYNISQILCADYYQFHYVYIFTEYICIAHLRINDDYGVIIIQDEYDEDKFSCWVGISHK